MENTLAQLVNELITLSDALVQKDQEIHGLKGRIKTLEQYEPQTGEQEKKD